MMKKLLLVVLLFIGLFALNNKASAQIALDWTDTAVCPPDTLVDCAVTTGQTASLNVDDGFSGVINIGFPFEFFGVLYSQCIITGNGYLTFNLGKANTSFGASWYWNQYAEDMNNTIFAAFADWNPAVSGNIYYATMGSEGHRMFVVEWCHIPAFGCGQFFVTTQLILFEEDNHIEVHTKELNALIGSCPSASSPFYGMVTQGVRNATGTSEFYPANRDHANVATNWGHIGATNDGVSFTPVNNNGQIEYQIDSIPFHRRYIIPANNVGGVEWYSEYDLNTPIATGSCATFHIDGTQHYYIVRYDGLGGCLNVLEQVSLQDTVWINYKTDYDTLDVNICQGETYSFFGRVLDHSGTYDTLMLNAAGCDAFTRLYLHVNPLPNVTLVDTLGEKQFCHGTPGVLSVANPTPNATYSWFVDGDPIGGNTPNLTTSTPGVYIVAATSDMGCVDTSSELNLSEDHVNIDYDILVLPGCSQDTIQIVNYTDSFNANYAWNFGDGSYPPNTQRNPQHIYQSQGTYQVTLVAEDRWGCTDSLTKLVEINHPIEANFISNKDSICQGTGGTVTFTNLSIGATSYVWDFDDGSPTQNGANVTHTFLRAGAHNVMLVASNNIPCSDTFYKIIYVDSLPFMELSAQPQEICVGDEVNFDINYLSSTANSLTWDFGDGITWPADGGISHHYDEPGTYIVKASTTYKVCPDLDSTITVVVDPMPKVFLGDEQTICLGGDPVTLKNLTPNPGMDMSYYWNTEETTPSIQVVHPGRYSLTVTSGVCSATEWVDISKDCFVNIPNAFTPNGDGDNDYFFPRQYLSDGVVGFSMIIYNRWGQKLFETTGTNGRGWDGRFNGKEQAQGVYVYQISVVYKNGRSEQYTGNVTLLR